jgi:hypothetical protein
MRVPRPSAPLVVSFLALFVALGGASWAAIHIPPRSVGNAQLQNFSVGNAKLKPFSVGAGKIIPGSIGTGQVNSGEVQLRVAGPCTDGAMQAIAVSGDVTCTQVLPNEYGKSAQSVPLGTGSTQVVSESPPVGVPYLVTADADVHLSENASGAQSVSVQCGLGLAGPGQAFSAATLGDFTTELDSTNSGESSATIPLTVAVAPSTTQPMLAVSCSDVPAGGGTAPTATVTATINAIQTASNN